MNRLKLALLNLYALALPIIGVLALVIAIALGAPLARADYTPGPQQIGDPTNAGVNAGFGTLAIFAGTPGSVQGFPEIYLFPNDSGGSASSFFAIMGSRTSPGTNNTDTTLTFISNSATLQQVTIETMNDQTGVQELGSNGVTAAPQYFQGELVSSTVASGSAVSLTTATPKTVTSITLTAGDWEVWCTYDFTLSSATTTNFIGATSLTTNNLGSIQDSGFEINLSNTTQTTTEIFPGARVVLRSSAPQTYFMVAQANFSAGTVACYGTMWARRIR